MPPKKKGKIGKKGKLGKCEHQCVPATLAILDPQPPGRYNLAFYFDYVDPFLKSVDESYLTFYHETLPSALKDASAIWRDKVPRSRVCCECDLIESVSTLRDFVLKIRSFASSPPKGKENKFGTIFLCAHGTSTHLILPIARARDIQQVFTFEDLAIGLKHIVAETFFREEERKPTEWTEEDWQSLREPLYKLNQELKMLHRYNSWFDEKTVIRFWCCNLGSEPLAGHPDPVELLGKALVGENGHVTLEAPRCGTCGRYRSYSKGIGYNTFQEERKLKLWHPDIVVEVESNKNNVRFGEDELKRARDTFISKFVRPAPAPDGRDCQWGPFWGMRPQPAPGTISYPGVYVHAKKLKDKFKSDGVQTSYKLRKRPVKGLIPTSFKECAGVSVESPPKKRLAENKFAVNYEEGLIDFQTSPKAKKRILVKYWRTVHKHWRRVTL